MKPLLMYIQKFILPLLFLSVTGCCSKDIQVIDTTGSPIPDVLIAAYQQNTWFYNDKRLFKTDVNGIAKIPFWGLVQIYTGKKGYEIEIAACTDSNMKITLRRISNTGKDIHISHLISEDYEVAPDDLWKEWVDYIKWLQNEHSWK